MRKLEHFHKAVVVLGILFVALVIFGAGILVGYNKGEFSERWDKNYSEIMEGQRSPFYANMMNNNPAPIAHGAFGQVIAINLPSIAIRGPEEIEKVVIISSTTIVRNMHENASSSAIKIGSWITSIGTPDAKGQIDASFIRIMPAPPDTDGMTPTTTVQSGNIQQ